MSEIGKPGNYPFTITLVRVIGEPWEDYIERCQDITNYVSGKHPKLPDEIRLINLDNFTQVSETAYEIITPGYEPQEEAGNERDSHFRGSAKLLFDKLYNHGDIWFDTADEDWKEEWQKLIAQYAYDLVCHSQQFMPGVENVPDITEWPE